MPVGEQQWKCGGNGVKDLPLTVSLLATEAEVETAAERLQEARETQLSEQKAAKRRQSKTPATWQGSPRLLTAAISAV